MGFFCYKNKRNSTGLGFPILQIKIMKFNRNEIFSNKKIKGIQQEWDFILLKNKNSKKMGNFRIKGLTS